MEFSEYNQLKSQRQFAPKCSFFCIKVGLLDSILLEYPDKYHNNYGICQDILKEHCPRGLL